MTVAIAMAIPHDAPVLCSLCGRERRFRRELCRCCYRKLKEAGIPLPPAAPPGPPDGSGAWSLSDRLRAWMRAVAPVHRAALRDAIDDIEGS